MSRRRGRSRPRSVDVFCSDESPMAPQLFCPVSLNVKHRDSRGRRTTTSTRTSPQFRSLGFSLNSEVLDPRPRRRSYSRSEVIHRAGDESIFAAFERERPRIVNNFAASASSGYELSSFSEKMNGTRLSNLAVVLESGNEYSDEDESSFETFTSGYKEFASGSGRANDHSRFSKL
jgi:hypothetical protein